MTDSTATHPGVTIFSLIDEVSDFTLRSLLGGSVVSALEALDPSFTETQTLRLIAKRVIDPVEALRSPEMRDVFINALSLEKAQELARKLGVPLRGDIYAALREVSADASAWEKLRSFFGVLHEERAPELTRPAWKQVEPKYGLFSHQRDAAERVIEQLNRTPRKVVLHMPTGSGKTRTAMHVIARHLTENGSSLVCWLAYNSELLEQAFEAFQEAWAHLGNRRVEMVRFWGGRQIDLDSLQDGLVVAGLGKMYAAYSRDPGLLHRLGDRTSLTVVDEAHQVVAPTHRWVVEGLYSKQPRNALLGLTATPGRTWADIPEDQQLSDFFEGCKVTLCVEGYDDPVSYLVDQGYLARPEFHTLEVDSNVRLMDSEMRAVENESDLPESVLRKLGEDGKRNVAIVRKLEDMMSRHQRILFFAASVEQARLVSAILVARGHNSDVVTGETSASARKRLIKHFRSSDPAPMVLANFNVLTAGFDAPNASAALIARPTRSLVLYSQMVGRATRGPQAGGNPKAEIVTVVDTQLPGFGNIAEAFYNWEDVWYEH